MGWFFTGVWSTLIVVIFIYSINVMNISGIAFAAICGVVTAFFIGCAMNEDIMKKEYKIK